MSVRSLELREGAGRLITEARAIVDLAETEKRSLTEEESLRFDQMHDDADAKLKTADRIERQDSASFSEPDPETRNGDIDQNASANENRSRWDTDEYRNAFNAFIVGGEQGLSHEQRSTLQADSDIGGGYLVAAESFVNKLLKAVDDAVIIRGLATKYQVRGAKSLGVPTLDNDLTDFDWTAELTAVTEDTNMSFGKRALTPTPITKLVKVSRELIRSAVMNPESIVSDRLAYKFSGTQETAFMTGSGHNQPLGVFTASADGITTARDSATNNTETAIGADGLIDAKYKLKPQYWAKAKWVFHRDAVKQIRKLVDGNGVYLWQPGLQAGQPQMIIDTPFLVSEFAPNTFTSGLYVGVLGDFSYYWIADDYDLSVQKLVELYAATNQFGYIGRGKCDGMPVMNEAFVRVKLA